MIKLPTVSSFQFAVLLIVSRMFSMFTYKPKSYNLSFTAALVAIACAALINFLIFLPSLALLKKYPKRNVDDCAYLNFNGGGKAFSFVFVIVCLFLAVESVSQFVVFLTSTIYMTASPVFFIIPMVLAALYICRLGIESIARTSFFVFFGVLGTLAIISVASSTQIDMVWFEKISISDASGFFSFLLENVCNTIEVIPLMFLAPNVKGGLKKLALSFCVVSAILLSLISFLTAGALGPYGQTVMFPFYTVAAMAENFFGERVNSLYATLWVFMAAIKICLYMLVAAKAMRRFVILKNDTIPLVISAVIVAGASLLVTQKITYLSAMYSVILSGVPLVLTAVLMPIIISIKGRRDNK